MYHLRNIPCSTSGHFNSVACIWLTKTLCKNLVSNFCLAYSSISILWIPCSSLHVLSWNRVPKSKKYEQKRPDLSQSSLYNCICNFKVHLHGFKYMFKVDICYIIGRNGSQPSCYSLLREEGRLAWMLILLIIPLRKTKERRRLLSSFPLFLHL